MDDFTLRHWLERIDNVIACQKECQEQFMPMRLTERELIELRVMVNTLILLSEKEKKDE